MSHEGRCRGAEIGAAGHTIISWAVAVHGLSVLKTGLGVLLLPLLRRSCACRR
jgi:hypothetical protein